MLHKSSRSGAETQSHLHRWLASPARVGLGRTLARLVLSVGAIIAAAVGMRALGHHVLKLEAASSAPLRVRLVDCPVWMPKSLAADISRGLIPAGASASQPDLTERVYARAMASPWIKSVGRVRKRPTADPRVAAVEVLAGYHRVVARVQVGRGYAYVSDAGVRLPAHEVPKYEAITSPHPDAPPRGESYIRKSDIPSGVWARPVHYILICGVTGAAPPVGKAWHGADLADGVRLENLVNSRKYARQILVVDLRNHNGRIDSNAPHLRMYAQTTRGRSTDIRFGQFPIPGGGDYVVSPQRKLSYIDQYVARNGGRLAGINAYIDLRYDQLHVSIN